MDNLVASIPSESQKLSLGDKSNFASHNKRPAPSAGGCRIEGYVRVKKVNFCMVTLIFYCNVKKLQYFLVLGVRMN